MTSTTPRTQPSDERAIANLMVEYAYLNDDFDIDGLGELFANSAFTLDGHTVRNRDEVVALSREIIQMRPDGRSATTHEITNIMITVDAAAGTANGSAYWTLYKTISGEPREALQSGRYADTFVIVDGEWQFVERVATALWHL